MSVACKSMIKSVIVILKKTKTFCIYIFIIFLCLHFVLVSEDLSTPNTSAMSPNISNQSQNSQSRLSTSPQTDSLNSSTGMPTTAAIGTPQIEVTSTPSTTTANQHHHSHHHYQQHVIQQQVYNQQTPSLHSRMTSNNINNNSSPLVMFPSSSSSSSNCSTSTTTSTSTSSLHQAVPSIGLQASRQLLSSSTSTSNIMGAAMQVDPVLLSAADEIGHGIPTPECLPQSRKHAISQSKLATPRLSTS